MNLVVGKLAVVWHHLWRLRKLTVRHRIDLSFTYLFNDHLHTDLIKNISRTGVCIESGKTLTVGATAPAHGMRRTAHGKTEWV